MTLSDWRWDEQRAWRALSREIDPALKEPFPHQGGRAFFTSTNQRAA
jgi:hypothetical protein